MTDPARQKEPRLVHSQEEEEPRLPTIQLEVTRRTRFPRRSRGTTSARIPPNKGRHYPADPPRVEEIVAVMHAAGERPSGLRMRGLIAVLWRAGMRISEALILTDADLEPRRGSPLVRHGKGRKAARGGMDDWGWARLHPWLDYRVGLPIGPLFWVISGATAGRPWTSAVVRLSCAVWHSRPG